MGLLCCIVLLELLVHLIRTFNIRSIHKKLHTTINLYNTIKHIIMDRTVDEEDTVADDDDDDEECYETGSEEEDNRRNIIFVEGPACIGKTTICDETFDYMKYLNKYSIFALKSSRSELQFLYDLHILTDTLLALMTSSDRGDKICDRSIYSQFVYGMLFRHDGHILDHETFKEKVDAELADPEIVSVIRHAIMKWNDVVKSLVPNCNVYLVWVVPTDEEAVAKQLKSRNTFEATRNFDLLNYTKNQIYLCKRFHEMSGDDSAKLILVDQFISRERIREEFDINICV